MMDSFEFKPEKTGQTNQGMAVRIESTGSCLVK